MASIGFILRGKPTTPSWIEPPRAGTLVENRILMDWAMMSAEMTPAMQKKPNIAFSVDEKRLI
jgi:hypothetical protein